MIPGIEAPEPLAPAWDALADRVGTTPFARPGWVLAWWSAFRPGGHLQALTLRERDGRLRAVVPLVRDGSGLACPSNPHTPAVGAVADSPDALARLADALAGLGAGHLRVAPLDAGDPLAPALRDAAARRRRLVLERTLMRSPYAMVPEEGPLALVSRSLRKEIGRGRRRLAEHGELTLEIARGPEDGRRVLAELVDIEARGWKGEQGTAIASAPETRAFYAAVVEWAAGRGALRLAMLRAGGRAVAGELDLVEGDALHSLKMGFDPEFSRFSPGHVLVAALLEELMLEGVRRYEMLGDDDAYKLRWTETTREMCEVSVFAPTPRGIAALGRRRVVPAVARRIRALGARGEGF